jgi:hypothetical protein
VATTRLIVGLITPHRIHQTTMKPVSEAKARSRAMLCVYVTFEGEATLRKIFYVNTGKAACKACSATWNLGTISAFALVPKKTLDNLHRVGQSQDLPDAY